MRILALVPGGITEQLLFFPTLETLKRSLPNAEIDVVVEPRAKSAYEVCKFVNQIIPFDFVDRNSLSDWANLLGIARDRTHDAAIMAGGGWGVGLLLWLTGSPIRVGYAGGSNQLFLTHKVPLKSEQYLADQYHDLLQGLNISASACPEINITIAKRHIDWAEAQQQQLGLKDTGYVMIYGGSNQPPSSLSMNDVGEQYPVEYWQEIIASFKEKQPDIPIVVAEWAGNATFVSALSQVCPDVKIVRPSSIRRLAAMIAGANLLLCPASVPMQLGVALKVYTLALFGSADPKKLLPESDRFVGIQSPSNTVADIQPTTILEKVWGG